MIIRTHPAGRLIPKTRAGKAERLKHLFKSVRQAISRVVTIEQDAIFKDPDWPHLWDHKR